MISEILKERELLKKEAVIEVEIEAEEKHPLAHIIEKSVKDIVHCLRGAYVNENKDELRKLEDFVVQCFEKEEAKYFAMSDKEFGLALLDDLIDALTKKVEEEKCQGER